MPGTSSGELDSMLVVTATSPPAPRREFVSGVFIYPLSPANAFGFINIGYDADASNSSGATIPVREG